MSYVDLIKQLKSEPNSRYYDLKYKFNYYSNKIEGSNDAQNYRNSMKEDIDTLYDFLNYVHNMIQA